MPSRNETIAYRPDIDGLRALAVLLVVAFHAFPHWLRGGFLGVDVFLVISGYLISRITLGELGQGRFSARDFYARRVRRIFPALILVLLTTVTAAWLLLPAGERAKVGQAALAAAAFVPNFWAWKEALALSAHDSFWPLIHLWSLGVEEQFYLLWPLLLLGAARVRMPLGWLLLALFLLACGFAMRERMPFEKGAFFLTQYRAWELALGCVVGWASLRHSALVERITEGRAHFLSGLGLALIAGGVGWVELPHAMLAGTAAATLGAALFILAGPGAALNRFVFSRGELMALGKISYPLYLWHWPLLAFARQLYPQWPAEAHAGVMLLAFPLAAATSFFVETPLKARAGRVELPLLAGMALTALVAWTAS